MVRVRSINQKRSKPYVQQWSAGFQQVLPPDCSSTSIMRHEDHPPEHAETQPADSTIVGGAGNHRAAVSGVQPNRVHDAGGNSIYHGLDATLSGDLSLAWDSDRIYWSKSDQ
jgi:hypothetical protein